MTQMAQIKNKGFQALQAVQPFKPFKPSKPFKPVRRSRDRQSPDNRPFTRFGNRPCRCLQPSSPPALQTSRPPDHLLDLQLSPGGSNSVVESQLPKLLVAGSIPVSRSSLRSRGILASHGWQAVKGGRQPGGAADLSAVAREDRGRRPM